MDRLTINPTSERLSGRVEPRGTASGLGILGGTLFGGVFAAAGGFMLAAGTGLVPITMKSADAPRWVLPLMGVVFTLVGLFIMGLAWRQWRAERGREARRIAFPGQPARADHDWDPKGDSPSRAMPVVKRFAVAAFITLFLAPFNLVFAQADAPWFVKGLVGLFDLVALALWLEALRSVVHALKFGTARLEYRRFPYKVGEPVELNWWPPAGVSQVDGGSFTLRCIFEWWEESGSGKSRKRVLVHEARWQGTWKFERARTLAPGQPVVLRFEPPGTAPRTALASPSPTFWELEVALEVPGLDYKARHLVPVY